MSAASALTLIGCQTASKVPSKPISITENSNSYENIIIPLPDVPDSDGDGILDDIDNCPKTPFNIAVDNDGCPVSVNLMGPLAIEIRTYFEQGSAEFWREGYATDIDTLAGKFVEYNYLPIIILGHISKPEALAIQTAKTTQANNKAPVNKQLAQDRAQLIKDRLVSQGVSANRIYTYDCGINYQIITDETDESTFMNQRVFGWSAVEDEKYIVQPHGLKGYQEKCRAF